MQRMAGSTLVELLISLTLGMVVILTILGVYTQGVELKEHVQGSARIQDNTRLALERVERDLLMIGFGVPEGQVVGGTTTWTPSVFHATPTQIGFRSDIDNGVAEIICTPKTASTICPENKLRLKSIEYYQGHGCKPPDGASGNLKLLAVHSGFAWQPLDCTAVDTSDTSLLVSNVTDDLFVAGASEAVTLEQVYLRFISSSARPYGTLVRQVRYGNQPSDTFPATGPAVQTVGRHILDFWLEYYDSSGIQLVGDPLTQTQRESIRSIVIFVEGYDQIGPKGHPQRNQLRSEVLVRNG